VTVLYCVARIDPSAAVPRGGLPGAERPRFLALPGGLTAIAATIPDSGYSPDIVNDKLRDMDWVSKAALGHEQVIEEVMRAATAVLPMKLLTLFSSDEKLLKDLSKQRRVLERAAKNVAGCEEYGLRIVALDAPSDSRSEQATSERPSSGTAFLERKKQARDEARDQAARRVVFAREAFEMLAAAARDAVSRPVQQDDMERPLIDAAFLIGAGERAAFGTAAEALRARAAEEHCVFKLTGPWPPYHFVQMSHASS
jgi:hypothetical protein